MKIYPINIIFENNVSLETIKILCEPDVLLLPLDINTVYIEEGNSDGEDHNYFSISELDIGTMGFHMIDIYEEEQKKEIFEHIKFPTFFLIQFTQFAFLKKVLEKLTPIHPLIDNDYGAFLTVKDLHSINSYKEFISVTQL